MKARSTELREIFHIHQNHELELMSARERIAPEGQRSSTFYREKDEQNNVVSYYRVWISQSTVEPFSLRHGWEKLTLQGQLEDRETRYSEGEPITIELPATVNLDYAQMPEPEQHQLT